MLDGAMPRAYFLALDGRRPSITKFGFRFPNHVSNVACRERIIYRMMVHERILDDVSQYEKRIRSQELRLLLDFISTVSPTISCQEKRW
jgi:hypothetical protein